MDNILKYFSYFSWKIGFDISCKLSPKETICMKCQILFSGKNKKHIINLSFAAFAQGVVKLNLLNGRETCNRNILKSIHIYHFNICHSHIFQKTEFEISCCLHKWFTWNVEMIYMKCHSLFLGKIWKFYPAHQVLKYKLFTWSAKTLTKQCRCAV